MVNILSSTSETHSSLQAPDRPRMETDGIPVDLAKTMLELQALNDLNQEEKQGLGAQNLVLEEECRQLRRLMEDKDEENIRLKEDVMSIKEKYDRLYVRHHNLVEDFESAQKKWKETFKKSKEEFWLAEVEKSKMAIDLQAARKGEPGSGDLVESKVVERLKRLLDQNEEAFLELNKEKIEIEEELYARVVTLERFVANWMGGDSETRASENAGMISNVHAKEMKPSLKKGMSSDAGLACSTNNKGVGDLHNSGPKSVGTPLIQPKEEVVEDDVQVKGNCGMGLCFRVSSLEKKIVSALEKEVTCAPKSTDSIIEISDDEDEDEEEEKEEKEEKHILSNPISSTPAWPRKRKYEAALACTSEIEKQLKTGLCESDSLQEDKFWETAYNTPIALNNYGPKKGKLWESPGKMHIALNSSDLCLKSICALYRKHNSLGVWKNQCSEIKSPLSKRAMYLGKLITGGDTEGKMNEKASDLKRIDEDAIMECRNIARFHIKELFEIYYNDMDPLFEP